MKKNVLIAQSGGPTAAINTTLSGIIQECKKSDKIGSVYGSLYGIQGIIDKRIVRLDDQLNTPEEFKLLECTPSMALGSCRLKIKPYDDNPKFYDDILETFKKLSIGYIFFIGGNDSMDTVSKLSHLFYKKGEDIKIIGVPKTIDNDLYGTDHTPGFGSAAKFVATTLLEVGLDNAVYAPPSVTIVEIMGRDAGWLTAASALALKGGSAPHLIYPPELPFDLNDFIDRVTDLQKQSPNVVITISEGLKLKDGNYLSDLNTVHSGVVDPFGHKYLSGAARSLERVVSQSLGCKVRAVELSVLQRSASHILSKTDIDEARLVGATAVIEALKGNTGKMVSIERVSNSPYQSKIVTVDVAEVANKVKQFPLEWIDTQNHTINSKGIEYLAPLILGEVEYPLENGLPKYFSFKRNLVTF